MDRESRIDIACHIKSHKNDVTFWQPNNKEIIIRVVFQIEIEILTLWWRRSISNSNSLIFSLLTNWFKGTIREKFTVIVRWHDRGQHDRSDTSRRQIFTFCVSEHHSVLHKLECGCVSPIHLVETNSSVFKQQDKPWQTHLIENFVDQSRCGRRVNSRLDFTSFAIQLEYRIIIETHYDSLWVTRCLLTPPCKTFVNLLNYGFWNEERGCQMWNLPNFDCVRMPLKENSVESIINQLNFLHLIA